jgi:hypothetical protein
MKDVAVRGQGSGGRVRVQSQIIINLNKIVVK